MKSKDQQLLEECYNNINENRGSMISIEVPLKLWKDALNAHKLPNSAEVLAMIMGEIVNLHTQKERAAKQDQADYHEYIKKVHSGEISKQADAGLYDEA